MTEPPIPPLRLFVAEYGTYLGTRSRAQRARMAAEMLLAVNPDAGTVVLDFAGVEAITNGAADELLAKLIAYQDDRRVVVEDARPEVVESLAVALSRRGLAVEGVPRGAVDAARIADLKEEVGALRQRAEQAEALLREQLDPYPCEYDHHGECQTHDRLADGTCMQVRIRDLIPALDGEADGRG